MLFHMLLICIFFHFFTHFLRFAMICYFKYAYCLMLSRYEINDISPLYTQRSPTIGTNKGTKKVNLMFIGPCIIVIVEERKTNLMSLAILFHFLCAEHVSDINNIHHQELVTVLLNYHIGRLLLSSLCVGDLVGLVLSGVRFAG